MASLLQVSRSGLSSGAEPGPLIQTRKTPTGHGLEMQPHLPTCLCPVALSRSDTTRLRQSAWVDRPCLRLALERPACHWPEVSSTILNVMEPSGGVPSKVTPFVQS